MISPGEIISYILHFTAADYIFKCQPCMKQANFTSVGSLLYFLLYAINQANTENKMLIKLIILYIKTALSMLRGKELNCLYFQVSRKTILFFINCKIKKKILSARNLFYLKK